MKQFALLVFIFGIIVSCETKNNNIPNQPEAFTRNMLRINLKEHILTLNPTLISTRTEKFVGFLLYEGLYKVDAAGKTTPVLVEAHKMDSLSFTHFFKIKPRIAFHNGDLLNTTHIYNRFKQIIDTESENPIIESFQNSIQGFRRYRLLKNYKVGKDSLPSGFKIINKDSFSIQFNQAKPDLLSTLSKSEFWIHQKINNNTYVGTGTYQLDYDNEDISFSLIKNKNYHALPNKGLDLINIRFIKNDEAEVNEFLNGSLDMLISPPEIVSPRKLADSKYGKFSRTESSLTQVKYLSLHNFHKLDLKNFILHLLQPDHEALTISFNKFNDQIKFETTPSLKDSAWLYAQKITPNDHHPKIKLPIFINCSSCQENVKIIKNNLSAFFEVKEVNRAQINPNAPYLVIEESNMHIYSAKPNQQTLREVLNKTKNYRSFNRDILILDYKREFIYSTIMLKGLKPYTNWEKALSELYFTQPTKLN